jgi:peptide/nickel transport system permease protein
VAIGVVVATFFLLRLVPGDPAQAILGDQATNASVEALRIKLGLTKPLWQQFVDFVVQLVTHGDTGASLVSGASTRTLIFQHAGVSIGIVVLAIVFSIVIAVPLALLAATHKDGVLDHLVRIIPAVGLAMPVFWLGLILIIVFAVNLHWLPVGGTDQGFASLILPALSVSIAIVPPIVRSLRAQLLEVLEADFVATFRSAGLPRWRILVFHVLRNAALPTITLFGINVAYLIGGTLVVERVFAINGIGAVMFQAIGNRDFPVVQGIALFCAILVVLVSILTDLAVDRLDPRTRISRG